MNERQRVTVRERERERVVGRRKSVRKRKGEKHYRGCYFHPSSDGI